jgi:thiamine pyrophosphokinase
VTPTLDLNRVILAEGAAEQQSLHAKPTTSPPPGRWFFVVASGTSLYALVFANGDLNDGPTVQAALAEPGPRLVIAADGGLGAALSFNVTPDLIIGDMDSADQDMLERARVKGAEVIRVPAAKDETDLELALLEAAKRGYRRISVIGFNGDRLDQTLGNISLLTLPALIGCDVRLVSHAQTTWLARPGETLLSGHPGDTVSLLPLASDAVAISTEGLEYPLRGETLAFGPARGMSNVMLSAQARFTFESGLLLVIHTQGRA